MASGSRLKAEGLYVLGFTRNTPGGTAKLRLTVLAWTRGDTPQDTVKLRWAVPPGAFHAQSSQCASMTFWKSG